MPFLKPERRTGEPRVWAWVLDRVLRRPVVALIVAGGVLVALAVPVLHIHTADSGVDGLPRSLEIMQTYDRMQAAFPGEQFTADVVVEGERRSTAPRCRRRRRTCARSRASSDQFHEPVTLDMAADGKVAVIEVPAGGHRHRRHLDQRAPDHAR